MHIADVFAAHKATFSFEFFPPKDEQGWDGLFAAIRELEPLGPHFVSVTYGAGGSSREETHRLVERIKKETVLDPIPHLTCVCHSEADIRQILERYAAAGVSNILALGGDPPRWMTDYDKKKDHFQQAADLVRFIKRFNASGAHPDVRGFGVGVAGFPEGHPATPNRVQEMDHLKAKVDAGADYICTQLFFENRDFYDFRDRCELAGIHVPIVAGLMPITSAGTFKRLPELALGARYPAKLIKRIMRHLDDPSGGAIRQVGIDWATQQARDLLENNVAGIHFYTLNRSNATIEIFRRLGAHDAGQLEQYVV